MLTTENIKAEHAVIYYEVKDNYYTKDAAGKWGGKGAKYLGLQGIVFRKDFENLLNGNDLKGKQLIPPGPNGIHRAGVDLTFSVPKSVSIAAEILGDTRILQKIEKSVDATLEYIEKNYAFARQTIEGKTHKIKTGNFIIGKFMHNVSRELDPQLHVHCVVMNMTRCPDKRWRAIENDGLHADKVFLGQVFRNDLALRMKELGYEIDRNVKGFFELKGFPKELIKKFSTRRQQVLEKAEELEKMGEGKKKMVRAAKESREVKKDIDMENVRATWQKRFKEYGYDQYLLTEKLFNQDPYIPAINFNDIDRAARALSDNESIFSIKEIVHAALRLSLGQKKVDHLREEFKKANQLRYLKEDCYTTKEILAIEKKILQELQSKSSSLDSVTGLDKLRKLFEEYSYFTKDQQNALRYVLSDTSSILALQGDAGTGKTTMFEVAAKELEEGGYEVIGLAPTGKAANELGKKGINSKTLDAFIWPEKEAIEHKRAFIIDEMSMVGSRKFDEFLDRITENDRVILCGDIKQLQGIEAGPTFQKLQEYKQVKFIRLKDNVRQINEYMKKAVNELAEKNIEKAFNVLDSHHCIKEIEDREERVEKVLNSYIQQATPLIIVKSNLEKAYINHSIRDSLKGEGKLSAEYKHVVYHAKRLSSVEKLMVQSYQENDSFFTSRAGGGLAAGTTGKIISLDYNSDKIKVEATFRNKTSIKEINVSEYGQNFNLFKEEVRGFAEGDKIVFLKGDKKLNLQNGLMGDIQKIDEEGNLKVITEDGEKTFNIHDYAYLDHGYAITDYKSQGMTEQEVIYVADTKDNLDYNGFYVAVTRAKENITIFTNDKADFLKQIKQEEIKLSTWDFEQNLSPKIESPEILPAENKLDFSDDLEIELDLN